MRIAVDAMGSDNAPFPEVAGAVLACQDPGIDEVILVGEKSALDEALKAFPDTGRVSVVHASEVITMEDHPAAAVRKKKDASMLVALRLVKQGKADGFVGAGNTGAFYLSARMVLGPIRGVARSALCQVIPTLSPPVVMLDMGANVDCTARHLCEFAEMGMLYSKFTLGVDNPRVGLLNIGEEQAKGNDVAKEVHHRLSASETINFVGNIEPRAIFEGGADVAVCDGYVGNFVLKSSEAAALHMMRLLKKSLQASWRTRLGAMLCLPAFRQVKASVAPDENPGAVLVGVDGAVFKVHGACDANGMANGIWGARQTIESGLTERIRDALEASRNDLTASH